MTSSPVRWTVPLAATALVGAGVAVVATGSATAAGALPERSAAQLLVDLGDAVATPSPVQGTVRVSTDLGLPALDGQGQATGSALGPSALLGGDTDVRVWDDGADRQRFALQGDLAEYSVLRDGPEVWTWSSDEATGRHLVLPDGSAAQEPGAAPTDDAPTPQAMAEQALAAVDPSTEVTVDPTTEVAGRAAYTLVLTPRDTGTLVGAVRLAVDGETSQPLAVQVDARGQADPAVSVAYTDVSFDAPGDDAFAPPSGELEEVDVPTPSFGWFASAPLSGAASSGEPVPGAGAGIGPDVLDLLSPQVTGEGWTTVVQAGVPGGLASLEFLGAGATTPGEDGEQGVGSLLDAATSEVEGGRALRTALVSVLLTDDGRVLAGSVPVETLQATAAQG